MNDHLFVNVNQTGDSLALVRLSEIIAICTDLSGTFVICRGGLRISATANGDTIMKAIDELISAAT